MQIELWQWLIAFGAALFVGISKTGVPGIGIFVVPLLAYAFGGRLSAGVMLPMLILGDCFAVMWYRRHAQWDKLVWLLPWVVVGMAFGSGLLYVTGDMQGHKDLIKQLIGALVLIMLALHFLRKYLGDKLTPTSKPGVAGTGISAGFATTVSNAAGPIMQIYLSAYKMPKDQFMGTIAWYFFIINCSKFPIYVILSRWFPQQPMVTADSLTLNLYVAPAIIIGAFIGKWILPKIPQKAFEGLILILSGIAALMLLKG